MSIENMYSFVTNPKRDLQGIAIKQGKYFGVIYEYDKVTFGKINEINDGFDIIDGEELSLNKNEKGEVILSFGYNVLDSYGFQEKDFKNNEFVNLLGDILVDVIDKYGTGEELESNDWKNHTH